MRNLKIVAALMFVIMLGGCASLPGKLGEIVTTITTTIENPVGEVDIYRVKNTYAAGLELAVEYRRYCWSAPYATLMADPVAKPLCERRRAVVRAMQKAMGHARAAIGAAERFIADNPTLNAATAVNAAWKAVKDFQSAVPVAK